MTRSNLRRIFLHPLTPLYGAIVRHKRRRAEAHPHLGHRLPAPVLSIGSISAGGAGKTPFTLLLTRLLREHGFDPIVLTRGYGRRSTATERVDPGGDPLRFGDEPLLLAQRTGAPVYVGRDRFRAAKLALAELPLTAQTLFLLDDGFQHLALHRDLDLVLLTSEDLGDQLLPAGNLREPISALRSAGIVVLREDDVDPDHLSPILRALSHGPDLWIIRRDLRFSTSGPPTRPIVFCGIARPENFVQMLRGASIRPVETVRFRDHHGYTLSDCRRLLARAQRSGADGFVTTEKDLVKFTPAMRHILEIVGPIHAPELRLDLLDAETALGDLLDRLGLHPAGDQSPA